MTSRERLLKAINHEEPDRIPINLGGNQTGIHKFAYEALTRYLGLNEEITIIDAVQQLAQPSEEILERFHVDTRNITVGAAEGCNGGIVQNECNGQLWHVLTDEFGVIWSMPESSPYYMDITYHPQANATIDDIRDWGEPHRLDMWLIK